MAQARRGNQKLKELQGINQTNVNDRCHKFGFVFEMSIFVCDLR